MNYQIGLVALALAVFSSCSENVKNRVANDDMGSSEKQMPMSDMNAPTSSSDFSNNQNESLSREMSPNFRFRLSQITAQSGQHYEGWLVTDSGVKSSGRFNVNESGMIYSVNKEGESLEMIGSNNVAEIYLADLSKESTSTFVLTIEPDGDEDPGPSSVHYVAGAFRDGFALAVTDHASAIGTSFKHAGGDFILATPSNGPETHHQGIWFLVDGAASLTLPTLNEGWAYEGWVVNTLSGEKISTGYFFEPEGEDHDGAGPAAGPLASPSFPGQDFIGPARILNSGVYKTVITVEPFPDYDPAPFPLKILKAPIEMGASVMTPIELQNGSNEADIFMTAEFL